MKQFFQTIIFILILSVVAFAQTTSKNVSQIERDKQELIRLDREIGEASNRKDAAMLERLIADDFAFTNVDGKTFDKTHTIAYWAKTNPKAPVDLCASNDERVRISGKTAIVVALDSCQTNDKDGKLTIEQSAFTDVWEKRNGRWLLVASIGSPAQSQTTKTAESIAGQTNAAQEFKTLLQEMADASESVTAKGTSESCTVAERTLADSYVQIYENGDAATKADILAERTPEIAEAKAKIAAETKFQYKVEDVDAQVYGATAVVKYVLKMRLVFNDEPVVKIYRATETFIKSGNRWQSVLHTETAMPLKPIAAKVDPKIYDDYVGQYRLTSMIIFTISREGDKLYWGKNRRELVPENDTTFVLKRDANKKVDENNSYRVIFVRDNQGKITHIRLREFVGVEYSAIKIK